MESEQSKAAGIESNQPEDENILRLQALNRMGQVVSSRFSLPEVLSYVTREASVLLNAATIIFLPDKDGQLVAQLASSGEGSSGCPDEMEAACRVMVTGKVVREESGQSAHSHLGRAQNTILAVPLWLHQEIVGVVTATRARAGVFSGQDQSTLESVANWIVIAISNARQYATIQQRLRESEALARISRSLLVTLKLEEVLQLIVEMAQQLIPQVDRAVIHLLNSNSNILEMAAATAFDQLEGPFFTLHPGEGVAGQVLADGKTLNVSNIQTDPVYRPLGARQQTGSLLVAPIQSSTHLLGTLSVRSSVISAFSADDERLLTLLGVQAALAINNARLFEAEQKSRQLAETLLQHETSTRAQLVQSEKLAALGRIVASVAHELNNPLQAIQNAVYLVRLDEGISAQSREDLQVALNETTRMADLIGRLRDTYRPATSEEFRLESLNSLVDEVQKLLATHMRHRDITLQFVPDMALPRVPMIRDQLRQVVLNLCLNASEAMPQGGTITILSEYNRARGEVVLAIADTGVGIPVDILPNIFEPFFTTKEGGTGLGLAISYDIIQRHNGRIEVASEPGGVTTFTLHLPTERKTQPLPRSKRGGGR